MEGLVEMGQEAHARTEAAEVWFWDMSLKEREQEGANYFFYSSTLFYIVHNK